MSRTNLDLERLNPNWKFATEHGQASKPGKVSVQAQNRLNSILMCPCCLSPIHKQPVSLWENPKEFSFLGYGFPLFYNLLITCLISLMIEILSSSALILFLSLEEDCDQDTYYPSNVDYTYPCRGVFVRMSRKTRDTQELQIDRLIRSLSFIGQAACLLYMREVQRKTAAYYDERNTRIRDFSVMFQNLPKIINIQARLKSFFKCFTVPIKVEEIFLIPKVDYLYELKHEKLQITNHLKKVMSEENPSQLLRSSLEVELTRIEVEILQACKRVNELYGKDELFSEKAIVILETKEQRKAVLQQFQRIKREDKQKYFFWMTDSVTLDEAPDPREIIWDNINYPKYKRLLRVILGWALSIVFVAIILVPFYFLVDYKASSHTLGMLIAALVIIQIFNKYVMKVFLHWFCDLEMPPTSSERQFSYACKYAFGMFFTTAVMAIIVEGVIYSNLEFSYGVVDSETIMFFFNAVVMNLLWIIHPQYYIHRFMRKIKFGKKNITQKQANDLMEDYPYDMGKRYAQVLETMWFTFLYASLIPFGAFLSFIGLCIYYWVDKYNLLRRSKIEQIERKLPLRALKLMEITLFWKPIGELIFDIKLRDVVYPETGVMIGLSIIFLLVPWDMLLDKFFSEKFYLSKQTYQEVKYTFNDTYATVDPIQRTIVLEKFIESRNKARLHSMKNAPGLAMPSLLQIRDYDNQNEERPRNNQQSSTREMVRNEI